MGNNTAGQMNDFFHNLDASCSLLIAGAYLLGSIPFGLLIGKAHGVDIREQGSGNIGATNLGRALGKRWAFAAFLLDFAKGIVPVLISRKLLGAESSGQDLVPILAGSAAILGHTFPIFLRFKGGKGVATTFGVIAAVALPAALAAGLAWIILYLTTRTVSMASLAAGITLPLGTCFLDPPTPLSHLVFSIGVACLIFFRHLKNISRILRGEEFTFKKKTSDGPAAKKNGGEKGGQP